MFSFKPWTNYFSLSLICISLLFLSFFFPSSLFLFFHLCLLFFFLSFSTFHLCLLFLSFFTHVLLPHNEAEQHAQANEKELEEREKMLNILKRILQYSKALLFSFFPPLNTAERVCVCVCAGGILSTTGSKHSLQQTQNFNSSSLSFASCFGILHFRKVRD